LLSQADGSPSMPDVRAFISLTSIKVQKSLEFLKLMCCQRELRVK
jgi:hypothetical protein